MLRFLARVLNWGKHPRAVVHDPRECGACRAIVHLKRQQKLAHELARELERQHFKIETLTAKCLCIRDPIDEQLADRRAQELLEARE